MKKRSVLRGGLIVVFVIAIVAFLANIALTTFAQVCGASEDQCGIAGYLVTYTNNVGSSFVAHETAVEAFGTFLVAIFTFTLWSSTEQLAAMAADQGNAVERSIKEAARAAEATNAIAEATRANANLMEGILHRQMRAYITVECGRAVYQDENLAFGSLPILNNAGFTPAKNVSYQLMAGIFNSNLPDDFQFETYGNKINNDTMLGPRQSFRLSVKVRERFPDADVKEIMQGHLRRLYAWGTVTYEDVFGGHRETNFCHSFVFYRGDDGEIKVDSYIHNRHNNAT